MQGETKPETPKISAAHPVLEELVRRVEGEPSQMKLALAIEGGGMRGVISAGMVAALEASGIKPEHFDAVFGSSAGSFNGAYYLAEQARFGTSIYYENNTSGFIDIRRLGRKANPALNLDYMLGHIMRHEKPIDFEKVVQSKKLRPQATEVSTASGYVFEPADDTQELYLQLRASATIPIVAGRPTKVADKEYLDASLTEAVPLETPIEQGYDAVLVLTTRPLVETVIPRSLITRLLDNVVERGVSKINPDLALLAMQRASQNLAKVRKLKDMLNNPSNPPYAFTVSPNQNSATVKRLEKTPSALIAGATAGYLAVKEALGLPLPTGFRTEGWFEEEPAS